MSQKFMKSAVIVILGVFILSTVLSGIMMYLR
ncbi:stressosome-associated protein Prli42 [Bacillus sp. L381]|nr:MULTISPECIES: stressosome-associated protein Prli42 [Bacillus]MBD0407816.1 stressosome-associated protein Prli42 [Bacillus sp. 1021]MCR9038756.1 stressosome-associated protein Prli42 [Bacillus velezensis]MDU0811592.1 stressosome-associated protein Prli42 [Bacillus siamensis]MEC3655017.1 stressosome-associated protein Prli42 [Bacillus siamensis]MED0771963.1 stressosome-associated protein Prli42 [Bacillus siamensis]